MRGFPRQVAADVSSCRDIGAAIYAGTTVMQLICVQGYLIDVYPLYAASAMAGVMVLRSLLGFALPLIAPSLYVPLPSLGHSLSHVSLLSPSQLSQNPPA